MRHGKPGQRRIATLPGMDCDKGLTLKPFSPLARRNPAEREEGDRTVQQSLRGGRENMRGSD